MHIGTGKFQGKKIKDSHDGSLISTRVLTVKESIFEVIGKRVLEASVLDVNDRNGMYGIEALSKGAAVLQFINLHEFEQKLIEENLMSIDLDPKDYILNVEPEDFFSKDLLAKFDIIFYRAMDDHCLSMLNKVLKMQSEDGITIVMYPNNIMCDIKNIPKGFQVFQERDIETERCTIILSKK